MAERPDGGCDQGGGRRHVNEGKITSGDDRAEPSSSPLMKRNYEVGDGDEGDLVLRGERRSLAFSTARCLASLRR